MWNYSISPIKCEKFTRPHHTSVIWIRGSLAPIGPEVMEQPVCSGKHTLGGPIVLASPMMDREGRPRRRLCPFDTCLAETITLRIAKTNRRDREQTAVGGVGRVGVFSGTAELNWRIEAINIPDWSR
jgi:hypothetical protein